MDTERRENNNPFIRKEELIYEETSVHSHLIVNMETSKWITYMINPIRLNDSIYVRFTYYQTCVIFKQRVY